MGLLPDKGPFYGECLGLAERSIKEPEVMESLVITPQPEGTFCVEVSTKPGYSVSFSGVVPVKVGPLVAHVLSQPHEHAFCLECQFGFVHKLRSGQYDE